MPATAYNAAQPPPTAPPALPAWAGQNDLQDCIHVAHQADRDRLINVLLTTSRDLDRKAALQLLSCGSYATFYVDADARKVVSQLFTCRHRLCALCSRTRVARAAASMAELVAKIDHPRQLILTVKSTDEPLTHQLIRIRKNFARLRRSRWWKARVAGGVYTLEITINAKTGLWHPHLHIIFDGGYLPHKQVQALWHKITGNSQIVWLTDVYDRKSIVAELCKYIGKPARLSSFTDLQLVEYAHATRGLRMIHTFGSLHGLGTDDAHKHDPLPEDLWHVHLSRVAYLAAHGSVTCQQFLCLIAARWPRFASYIWHQQPQLEPPASKHHRQLVGLARLHGRAPPQPPGPPSADNTAELDSLLFDAANRLQSETDRGLYDLAHPVTSPSGYP